MQLQKTDRARAELQPGTRTLGQRERALLLLADGVKTTHDFRALFNGAGEDIALRLLEGGYLQISVGQQPFLPLAPGSSVSVAAVTGTAAIEVAAEVLPAAVPSIVNLPGHAEDDGHVEHPQDLPDADQIPAISSASDRFEGKRSLATTRMFLFDLCERMFARRDPAMAEHFRESLRSSKDRQTMLAAAGEMIEEIEKAAGRERADSIRERIAMLLPDEVEQATA